MALREVGAVRCVEVAQVKQTNTTTTTARDGGGINAGDGGHFDGIGSWPAGEQRVGAELPVRSKGAATAWGKCVVC